MEVYEKICKKFSDLEERSRSRLGSVSPLNEKPGTLSRKWFDNFGNRVINTWGQKDIPDDVIEFIKFVNSVIDTESFLQCKEPLTGMGITFEEIAGQKDAKRALYTSYIYPLEYTNLFRNEGKGFLLYGPPGTGKTLLAKAATGALQKVAFFNPTPGEIKGKYVGETEKNIKAVFDCAEAALRERPDLYQKAIIFFDEFDSIGGDRSGDDPNMKLSVNALLQEMEGVRPRPGVSVLAATNYPESLDPAILRRLTQRIPVDIPDTDARYFIITSALLKNYTPLDIIGGKEESKESFDARVKSMLTPFSEERARGLQMWNDIDVFGTKDILEKEGQSGWFSRKSSQMQREALNWEYLQEIVKKTGPNDAAEKFIASLLGKSFKTLDDAVRAAESSGVKFGYSASDLTKMMELAINFAAMRTVMKGKISRSPARNGWYIAGDEGEIMVNEAPPNIRSRIFSYDIRLSDVMKAIDKYPSTILTENYCRFLFTKYGL